MSCFGRDPARLTRHGHNPPFIVLAVAPSVPAAGSGTMRWPRAGATSAASITTSGTCIRARAVPRHATFANPGARLHVKNGAVVWVVLAGPASWASSPWRQPASSNVSVLRSVPFCSPLGPSSAPLNWTVFRALRPGRAVITAPLLPGLNDPQYTAYRAVVFVAAA